MAFGGALMVRAAIGFAAYNGIMLALHGRRGWPLAPIRLAMEATVFVVGALLGGAIGIGTVITGILIGPGLHFWLRRLDAVPVAPHDHASASGGRASSVVPDPAP
jgi:uncharacterized membrane protein YczE